MVCIYFLFLKAQRQLPLVLVVLLSVSSCHQSINTTVRTLCSCCTLVHIRYPSCRKQPCSCLSPFSCVYALALLCDVPRVVFTPFSSTLFPYVFRPPPPSSFISVSFSWIHTPRAASHSLFWTKWLKLFNVTQMNKRTITMNSANIKTITRIEEKTYWSMDVVAWYGLSLSV